MHDPFSNSETPTVAETPNPSNVTLVCPIRGQITQTIDANNPPTLSELTRIVGGSFGRSDASYFQQTGSGPQPLNPNQNVSPGMTISVTHGYKGGKG